MLCYDCTANENSHASMDSILKRRPVVGPRTWTCLPLERQQPEYARFLTVHGSSVISRQHNLHAVHKGDFVIGLVHNQNRARRAALAKVVIEPNTAFSRGVFPPYDTNKEATLHVKFYIRVPTSDGDKDAGVFTFAVAQGIWKIKLCDLLCLVFAQVESKGIVKWPCAEHDLVTSLLVTIRRATMKRLVATINKEKIAKQQARSPVLAAAKENNQCSPSELVDSWWN